MLEYYFPKCTVVGPVDPPVKFGHMVTSGAVPMKCSRCPNLFEGECRRNSSIGYLYAHLDFGPCGIPGKTDPVVYEHAFLHSNIEIPRKCLTCNHLSVTKFGLRCTKDAEKWGDYDRGFDWGDWEPDTIVVRLPLPKVTTQELREHAISGNLASFLAEYRKLNPGFTIVEAEKDFHHLQSVLNETTNKPLHRSGG